MPYGLTLSEESIDSIVHTSLQQSVNPVFTDVDAVLVYRELEISGNQIDSLFLSLPTNILKNVATVVINKDGRATKLNIVHEYLANQQVYDNLASDNVLPLKKLESLSTMEESRATKVDSASTPVDEITYRQHDTTLNGKPYKVTIEQKKKYESK